MTTVHISSLVILAAAFLVASVWRLNLGILLFCAAYALIGLNGMPAETITDGFPVDVFLLLVGVTFFFAVVESSRTLDYIVEGLLKLLRGKVVLVPFVFFALAGFVTAIGTYPTAVAALILPVAMRFARDFGINDFMVGVMVLHGVLAGNFSPISTFGVLTDGVLTGAGVPSHPVGLFLSHFAVQGIACSLAFLLFGGLKLVRAGRVRTADEVPLLAGGASNADCPPTAGHAAAPGRPSTFQVCTMAALVLLIVSTAVFGIDVGAAGLFLGAALTLGFARKNNDFVSKMPWSVMILVAGVLSYVAVLTQLGTLDAISDLLTQLGSPLLAVLALSLLGAITSAFASSIAILSTNLQLAVPLVSTTDFSVLSVFAPVTISTTIVDASPLSVGGALILANAEPERRSVLLRKLLLWGLSMILIGPLLAWLLFTVL